MQPPRAATKFSEHGREAWAGFLETHSRVVRRLDAELAASHGLTLSEYEVLLKLSLAGGRLRMSGLAEAAWISRSGLTRIVDELERQELVVREADEDDGRAMVAALTRRGRARFAAARRAHLANVHALFLDPLSIEQRRTLGEAWAAIAAALPDSPDERTAAPRRRARRARRLPA